MSRRKQGSNPQHRSSLTEDGSEMEAVTAAMWEKAGPFPGQSDLLTCGQCRCTFPLRHILSFIEHKRMQCDPSKYCQARRSRSRSPSPISDMTELSPLLSDTEAKTRVTGPLVKREISVQSDSEPSCYICTTCNDEFTSAWFLLHHAQNIHRLQIYLSSDDDSSPLVKQIDNCFYRGTSLLPQPCDLSDHRRSSTTSSVEEAPQAPRERLDVHGHTSLMNAFTFSEKDLSENAQRFHFGINPIAIHRGNREKTFMPFQATSVQEEALNFSTKLRELAGNSFPHSPGLACQAQAHSPFRQVHPGVLSEDEALDLKRRSCEFCGKTFKSLSNLVVHRRSHTGEKPYQCRFCDHACTQSSKLKRHMKVHRLKETMSIGDDSNVDTDLERLENCPQDDDDEEEGYEIDDQGKSDKDNRISGKEELQDQGDQDSLQDPPMCISFILSEKYSKNKKPMNESETGMGTGSPYQQNKASENAQRPVLFTASPGFYHSKESTMEHKAQDGVAFTGSIRAPEFSLPKRLHPSPENLLSYIKKRVKLEHDSEPLVPLLPPALHSFYSQWFTNCSDSQNLVKELFPSYREVRPPFFNNSSESSFDPGNSQAVTGDDSSEEALSSESGIASGNCTPKQNGLDRGGSKRSDTCEFCGKVFRNSSNLTVHRRSHTGERPYHCQLCNYACAQSSKLTRHMKTHLQDGKPAFQCEKCNIPFSVFSTLEKHMKKYHGATLSCTELNRAKDVD
ncbi:zinc finger protein 296 isoform X1 [Pleurodeles waltl]